MRGSAEPPGARDGFAADINNTTRSCIDELRKKEEDEGRQQQHEEEEEEDQEHPPPSNTHGDVCGPLCIFERTDE